MNGPGDEATTPGEGGEPSEEEMRARLEEQMRNVRVQDLVLQSVAGLINLTARRIAKDDERDLEQAKVGIEAVRSLLEVLEPEAQSQVKSALSELQLLYAQQSRGEGGAPPSEGGEPPGGGEEAPRQPPGERPAAGREPPPRLWTPPGAS